jgi:hypothetical protein
MIRARLELPAATAVARKRRQKASASTAAASAAPSAGTGKPPLEPALRACRVAKGRETQARRSAIPAGTARPGPRRRADCRCGRAGTRGRAVGLCSRRGSAAVRPRELRSSPDSLPRPSATLLGGPADSAERTPECTGAGKAVATPVFTSGGTATSPRRGVGTAAACVTGAAAAEGSAAGTGCPPVAGGLTGACSATGRKSSGSRYPFGSELRRTPR